MTIIKILLARIALGAALLGWFVLGLLTGHSYQTRPATVDSTSFAQKEDEEFAAMAGD